MTKTLGLFAFALAGFFSTNAFALGPNCEMPNGGTLSGNYIPNAVLDGSAGKSGAVLATILQDGCELRVKSTVIETSVRYMPNQKLKTTTRNVPAGTWILDLTGNKKAVIPKEYIKANSNDPKSAAMTKSLEVYTTLQDDGKIDVKLLFDFEHDGTIVKMSAEGRLASYQSPISYQNESYSGMLSLDYPGLKFRVVSSGLPAEKRSARSLVIGTGANWLLEALDPVINSAIRTPNFSFMRK